MYQMFQHKVSRNKKKFFRLNLAKNTTTKLFHNAQKFSLNYLYFSRFWFTYRKNELHKRSVKPQKNLFIYRKNKVISMKINKSW